MSCNPEKEMNDEGCPCGESTCSAQCEVCQDLPIGYFENRRREDTLRARMPVPKNGMYYCPKCDFHAPTQEQVYFHMEKCKVEKSKY
jgi:hypothetical protein